MCDCRLAKQFTHINFCMISFHAEVFMLSGFSSFLSYNFFFFSIKYFFTYFSFVFLSVKLVKRTGYPYFLPFLISFSLKRALTVLTVLAYSR